ncbi:glycosyltransferase [Paenibacillus kobensis]|uniref:glycosyltransferase n=1 Tax=Paenibacillus kobensis TaxID=59841 RepID=UPI000FDC9C3F|nr:nucleotide disphospho-sugar-binding domain-containing protein [Paenibacillus kobensis]
MERIFFGLSGGLAPLNRCLPAARILKQKGYEVAFSVYGAKAAEVVKDNGFIHLEDADPMQPTQDAVKISTVFYNLDHYYAQRGFTDERFVEQWIAGRIEMVKQYKPRVVISDQSPHTAIAAKYFNLPLMAIGQSCFHPFGEALFFEARAVPPGMRVTPIFNRVLHSLGLPPITKVEDLNLGDINLVLGVPEMDPITMDSIKYAGPILSWIPMLKKKESESSCPLILVEPGHEEDSIGVSIYEWVKRIIDALYDQPYRVKILLSERLPRSWRERMKPDMELVPEFSPDIVSEAALMIHSGTHGSCMKAIVSGIPSLILPTHTEREFYARKLASLGVGEFILPTSYNSTDLIKTITFMLKRGYKDKACRIAESISQRPYGGKELMVELILLLAGD